MSMPFSSFKLGANDNDGCMPRASIYQCIEAIVSWFLDHMGVPSCAALSKPRAHETRTSG